MRLCLIYRCARKTRLRPMLGSVAISDSGSPPVLPGDAKQIEVIPRARRHAAARIELDRVANIEGECERSAEAPILLEVVVEHAVDRRAPAREVGCVDREPGARLKSVDHVGLRRIDGVLRALVAAVEIVVIGVERRGGGKLERPGTFCLGHAELRLEPPAVGAEVHDPLAVVLTPRRGYLQAWD